jgi:hypothetical protein
MEHAKQRTQEKGNRNDDCDESWLKMLGDGGLIQSLFPVLPARPTHESGSDEEAEQRGGNG